MHLLIKLINLMEFRRIELERTIEAQGRGAPPLIAYDGHDFASAGFTDDLGLYFFVPPIARALQIDAHSAATLFLIGMLFAGGLLALVGVLIWCRSWCSRAVALFLIARVGGAMLRIGDVYVVFAALALAVVPLFLVLWSRARFGLPWIGFCFLAGLGVGVAHVVRAHSGTAVLLFVGTLLLGCSRLKWNRRLILVAAVLAGIGVNTAFFQWHIGRRNHFLAAQGQSAPDRLDGHPTWHSIYLGLGYVENAHGIRWHDRVAMDFVASVDPEVEYCTVGYERILRNEVFRLIRNEPSLLARNIAAKSARLGSIFLEWAGLGLIAAVVFRKALIIDAAFLAAVLFNCIFGLIALPSDAYSTGLIAFASLFGLFSLCHLIDNFDWRKRFASIASKWHQRRLQGISR